MADAPELDVCGIFANGAREILAARDQSKQIHGTKDIRAAGNEVEVATREYLARTLPTKFHVSHGHVVDRLGKVSPQLDVIVSDNALLPSLMRGRDGTEYVPFDSAYAFGEIKSTYRAADRPVQHFSSVISKAKSELSRPLVQNTFHDGVLRDDTIIDHISDPSPNRVLNPLLTFMVFVDKGDFKPEALADHFSAAPDSALPSVIVFLNGGVVFAGEVRGDVFCLNRQPEYHPERGTNWYFTEIPGSDGSMPEGNHLGFLYYMLIQHLAGCRLKNDFSGSYFGNLLAIKRAGVRPLRGSPQ
jgi:hypothetical protein